MFEDDLDGLDDGQDEMESFKTYAVDIGRTGASIHVASAAAPFLVCAIPLSMLKSREDFVRPPLRVRRGV
jgi:hypothetical protein